MILITKTKSKGISWKTTNLDPDDIINEDDNTNHNKELSLCYDILEASELENQTHQSADWSNKEKLSLHQQSKACSVIESSFWNFFGKYKKREIHIILRTRKSTLVNWSKIVCNMIDLTKLKVFIDKCKIMVYCIRKDKHAHQKNSQIDKVNCFLRFTEKVPMRCEDADIPIFFKKINQSTVWRLERTRESFFQWQFLHFLFYYFPLYGNWKLVDEI